jgi:hypothetical protein
MPGFSHRQGTLEAGAGAWKGPRSTPAGEGGAAQLFVRFAQNFALTGDDENQRQPVRTHDNRNYKNSLRAIVPNNEFMARRLHKTLGLLPRSF